MSFQTYHQLGRVWKKFISKQRMQSMHINKIKRKIKILELFDKAKQVENKKYLIALAEKKFVLNEFTVANENIACEISEIEKGLVENPGGSSLFNFHQKYHYLVALDEQSNTLSKKLALNQRETSELENKIK